MSRVLDIEQGSDEWLQWRLERCMSSDASVIMGSTPSYYTIRTWADLREARAGFRKEPSSYAEYLFREGHRKEELARKYLNSSGLIDVFEFKPACLTSEIDGIEFGTSLDCYNGLDIWVEIKCPRDERSKRWEFVRGGSDNPRSLIQDHDWWQMVHQAAIINMESATGYYMVYDSNQNNAIIEVPWDELMKDWPRLLGEWKRFESGETQFPVGDDWIAAAQAWYAIKGKYDMVQGELDAARDKLLSLGSGVYENIEVKKKKRAGSVDWKKFASDKGISDEELKTYKKRDSHYMEVTIKKEKK